MISLVLPQPSHAGSEHIDRLVRRVNQETRYFLDLERRVDWLFQQMRKGSPGDSGTTLSIRVRKQMVVDSALFKVVAEGRRVLERLEDPQEELAGSPFTSRVMLHPEAWRMVQARSQALKVQTRDMGARWARWNKTLEELKWMLPEKLTLPRGVEFGKNPAEQVIALFRPLEGLSDRFEAMDKLSVEDPVRFSREDAAQLQREWLEECAFLIRRLTGLVDQQSDKQEIPQQALVSLILVRVRRLPLALGAEILKRVLPSLGYQLLVRHDPRDPVTRAVLAAQLYALPKEALGRCHRAVYPMRDIEQLELPPNPLTVDKEFSLAKRLWEKLANNWQCAVEVLSPCDPNLHVSDQGELCVGDDYFLGDRNSSLIVRLFWDGRHHYPIAPERGELPNAEALLKEISVSYLKTSEHLLWVLTILAYLMEEANGDDKTHIADTVVKEFRDRERYAARLKVEPCADLDLILKRFLREASPEPVGQCSEPEHQATEL